MNSVLLKIVRILFLFLGCRILDFMDKLRCTSFSLFRSAFHAGEFCQMLVGHLLAVKKVFEVVCVGGMGEGKSCKLDQVVCSAAVTINRPICCLCCR